tara:strand:- start:1629 stop:1997 length:369 start_codon:yes stop_codon:yes gene_type:complete
MINLKSKRLWMFIMYLSILIGNSFFTFINLPIKHLWRYDKTIHFIEYFILGFLLFNVLYEKAFTKKQFIYYVIFISIIPIIDESIQFFTPYRISSFYDLLADYSGAYLGCLLYSKINKGLNG